MYKIAVLGERESVMGFAALGLAVFPVESAEEAAEAFHRLTRQKPPIWRTSSASANSS